MSTSANETTKMELQPYVFFYGKTQEALDFYTGALGGSYEATPHEGRVPTVVRNTTASGPIRTREISRSHSTFPIKPRAIAFSWRSRKVGKSRCLSTTHSGAGALASYTIASAWSGW